MDILLIIRILVALAGTGIAAWYDIYNKKNVPDRLLYAFVAVAFLVNITDFSLVISRLPLAALMIIALYLMYRAGQLGGADLFVLIGIYLALPAMSAPLMPSGDAQILGLVPLPSLFTILALSAVLCALWLIIKLGPPLVKDTLKGKIKFKTMNFVIAFIMLVVYGFLLVTIVQFSTFLPISPVHIAFLTMIVILVFFFSLYKDAAMARMVIWKKRIEPEEALSLESLPLALVQKMHLGRLITLQQMRKMNKLNRKWPVLDLPAFLPCILIGLIIYILFGDSILFFV